MRESFKAPLLCRVLGHREGVKVVTQGRTSIVVGSNEARLVNAPVNVVICTRCGRLNCWQEPQADAH